MWAKVQLSLISAHKLSLTSYHLINVEKAKLMHDFCIFDFYERERTRVELTEKSELNFFNLFSMYYV